MEKDKRDLYQETDKLREIIQSLQGQKFKLDCGHHITFGHHLGNNIFIFNGKEIEIICSLCGY